MHDIKGHLGPFLTALTFDRIRVVTYMTKISFLTAFFSVRLRAPKRNDSMWSNIQLILCFVYVSKKKNLAVCLGPFLTGLKRVQIGYNLCISGIFGSYQKTALRRLRVSVIVALSQNR